MKILIIDDIGISITIKYRFNMLNELNIVECTNNITGRRLSMTLGYKGKVNYLGRLAKVMLDKSIKGL